MGAPRQTAAVYVGNGEDETTLRVPLAVGRILARAADDGTLAVDDASELRQALARLERKEALVRVAGLVNRRDYSRKEVRDRLVRDGYPQKVVDGVVERSVELRLLDDDRFAETFVRTKRMAGWGRARIALELARRGIEAESCQALEEAGEGELDRARQAASRKSFHGKDPYAQCVRFLVGRGFSPGIAHEVAREIRDLAEE